MRVTIKEIASQLAAQAEAYVRWLLPNGRKESGEWCVGSVDGEAGCSCKIRISGSKAGVFMDFAGTDKGDLLTLTSLHKRVTLGEAIRIAKEWLGIIEPQYLPPKRNYNRPKPRPINRPDAVMEYLWCERKLNRDTQNRFRIGEYVDAQHGPVIIFPSFSPSGELTNNKFIALKRNEKGKKIVWSEAGCSPTLFGWQALIPDTREVVLTEGQLDCMTWHQNGFPALSVPDGAVNDAWIDFNWDDMQQFERIYLHFDDDDEGNKAVTKIAARLGLARCFVVRMPGSKDANEALQKGCSTNDFAAAIAAARPLSPKQIKSPSDLRQKVLDELFPPSGVEPGFFPDIFHNELGLRPGEVSVWTGIAGHGKSALLNQIALEAVLKGYRVAIASMEMLPQKTIRQILYQSETDSIVLTAECVCEILDWLTGRLWIYDLLGNVQARLILDLMDYSFARHGVNLFVIDSLMKCSIESDDYNAQRAFLNDLCAFAMNTGTHVNLVAHSRKGANELTAPGKLDVSGSADIINQPANVLTVWRNKEKEAKKREGDMSVRNDDPDTIVFCNKQRETGVEFAARFAFNQHRFVPMNGSTRLDLSINQRIHAQPIEQHLPYPDDK